MSHEEVSHEAANVHPPNSWQSGPATGPIVLKKTKKKLHTTNNKIASQVERITSSMEARMALCASGVGQREETHTCQGRQLFLNYPSHQKVVKCDSVYCTQHKRNE